jgi:hypothetical protein
MPVVAMTCTGASIKRDLLASLNVGAVVMEEAGKVS